MLVGKHNTSESFTTDTGQFMVNVHAANAECAQYGCVIHFPSAEGMALGKTHYNTVRQQMQRVCEHGVAHPDPDSQNWRERTLGSRDDIHICDGCCEGLGAISEMPAPSCPLGYTRADLRKFFGAIDGQPHPLWAQLRGQTGAICQGHLYNHETREYEPTECADRPHGFVVYVHDVQEWVEGKPVSDW